MEIQRWVVRPAALVAVEVVVEVVGIYCIHIVGIVSAP